MKTPSKVAVTLLLAFMISRASHADILGLGSIFGSKPIDSFEGVKISDGVEEDHARKIVEDLKFIKELKLSTNLDSETQTEVERIMKLRFNSQTIGSSLFSWLKERVTYIVGEKFDLEKNIEVVEEIQEYHDKESPVIEKPSKEPENSGTVKTIMSNIGSAVYFAGKDSRSLMGLKINGDTVPIRSPRTGVVQVGSGLFSKTNITKDIADASIIHRLVRLETFFHEARHSDGHGKSLGFFHATCPKGHPFEGYAACDRNLNGPYSVGAAVLKALKSACETTLNCSEKEKAQMDLAIADNLDRVIRLAKDPNESEIVSKVRTYKIVFEVCKKAEIPTCKQLKENLKNSGISPDDFDKILKEGLPLVPTKDWDDKSEEV